MDKPALRAVLDRWLTSTQPAVIFDFNGTLSDDEHIIFEVYAELFLAHFGHELTAHVYRDRFLGLSDREIVELAVAEYGCGSEDQVAELLGLRRDLYGRRVAEHNPIGDDAVGLLRLLAGSGIPRAIVTGARRDDAMVVLNASPAAEFFDVVVTEEDVRHGKPNPEGFLAGARLLRRRPSDVLVFEDSVPGVRAALAARMHCIAVSAEPTPDLRALAPVVVDRLSAELLSEALPG
jgi:beta-phosphoglucomutase-like phosphatase (HAD superfamily)